MSTNYAFFALNVDVNDWLSSTCRFGADCYVRCTEVCFPGDPDSRDASPLRTANTVRIMIQLSQIL
jgi:hypothetical protein